MVREIRRPWTARSPTGNQYPSTEGDGMNDAIVADVDIPGTYPSDRGDPTGEPLPLGQGQRRRDAPSPGDLTENGQQKRHARRLAA